MPNVTPSQAVILGAGFIGVSFAAILSDSGWTVVLVDPDGARREAARDGIAAQVQAMELAGLRRGGAGAVEIVADGGTAFEAARIVFDCGPENLEIKQAIFAEMLRRTGAETVLVTASSAITMSRILPDPADQARCLVAHPVNPPAVLRVIELVPAPGTSPETTRRAAAIFEETGFSVVTLGHEIEGFILNRLQGAVLREAYRLVDEGVADVEGVDTMMRLGLGPRWALSGPFETVELNTAGGITAHAARMGPAYKRMGEMRGEQVDWHPALVSEVAAQRRDILPESDLPRRVAWRADAVARLVAFRDRLMRGGDD